MHIIWTILIAIIALLRDIDLLFASLKKLNHHIFNDWRIRPELDEFRSASYSVVKGAKGVE